MKKLKIVPPTDRMLIFIILLLIGLMAGVLWVFGQRLNDIEKLAKGPYGQNAVSPQLSYYIQNAVSSLYTNQPVTDPTTQRVYIPEARIYLPMTSLSRNLFYEAGKAMDSFPEQYSFNTAGNLRRTLLQFSEVTCLQRMAGFTINKMGDSSAGTKYYGSNILADKRVLYLYGNENAQQCNNYWFGYNSSAIIELLKQAKSY